MARSRNRAVRGCQIESLALALGIILCAAPVSRAQERNGTNNAAVWREVFAEIRQKWPEVPHMGTDELQRRLELPKEARPLVIDTRSRAEFNVSHLPGAVWAESPAAISGAIREAPVQRAVVLYCSVGIRSSRAAARLIESGRTNVFNLNGSIFKWANEGRRIEKDGKAVTEVHPYNRSWGRMLDPSLHPKETD